jgi:hypothetical protein
MAAIGKLSHDSGNLLIASLDPYSHDKALVTHICR